MVHNKHQRKRIHTYSPNYQQPIPTSI